VNRGQVQTVALWLLSVLAGTCTLGVVLLERAAAPVREARAPAARVALIQLAANPVASDALPAWEGAARVAGLRVESVSVASLADVSRERFAVWVLAEQERLSDLDWSALDGFAARGGGLILTGAPGVRDGEGAERERLPLRRLFPAHDFERRGSRPEELRAGPRSPLVVGLAPGQRMPLAKRGREAPLSTTTGGALTWDSEPGAGAVLAGLHRGAPVVWLGCAPEEVAAPAQAAQLALNALRYAAREAAVDVQPWPGGSSSAALLGIAAGSDLELASSAARSLVRRGVRPLLVLTPEAALADPGAARAMASLGELAVRLAPGSSPGTAREQVAGAAGREVHGAVVAAGEVTRLDASFEFAALESNGSAVPELMAPGVVALPRSRAALQADAGEAQRVEALLAALEHSDALGGMYHVVLEPEWLARASLPVAELLSTQLHARGAWLATPGELARWWRARLGVEASLEEAREGEWIVRARNAGGSAARGVTLRIYLPAGEHRPRLEESGWFAARPLVRYASGRTWMELVLPELASGATVQYTLLF
jgi:hypothetical protein